MDTEVGAAFGPQCCRAIGLRGVKASPQRTAVEGHRGIVRCAVLEARTIGLDALLQPQPRARGWRTAASTQAGPSTAPRTAFPHTGRLRDTGTPAVSGPPAWTRRPPDEASRPDTEDRRAGRQVKSPSLARRYVRVRFGECYPGFAGWLLQGREEPKACDRALPDARKAEVGRWLGT